MGQEVRILHPTWRGGRMVTHPVATRNYVGSIPTLVLRATGTGNGDPTDLLRRRS